MDRQLSSHINIKPKASNLEMCLIKQKKYKIQKLI